MRPRRPWRSHGGMSGVIDRGLSRCQSNRESDVGNDEELESGWEQELGRHGVDPRK